MPGDWRHLGAPEDVPGLRACRLLRLFQEQARRQTFPPDPARHHAVGPAGRDLALVLRGRDLRLRRILTTADAALSFGTMAQPLRFRSHAAHTSGIHEHALENLRFIRETMERSGSFTAVPGWGGVAMGLTALAAAPLAEGAATPAVWLAVWSGAALLAFAIGLWAVLRKARAVQSTLLDGPGRKFALSLCPAMIAGGILTLVLYRNSQFSLMPGMWL